MLEVAARNARAARPASAAARLGTAIFHEGAAVSPDAATICGEGVSPAARAAANGSPPGRLAATARADDGRCEGSGSRQRRMALSTAGSSSFTSEDGLTGLV